LPAWFTRGIQLPPVKLDEIPHRLLLVLLFDLEREYAERLSELDQLIDKSLKDRIPVPLNDLAKASRDFVGLADDLDNMAEQTVFSLHSIN
jgi:hypothetical protein